MQSPHQHCWLYSSLYFSMGECSLGSSQWVVRTYMHQSFLAFTSTFPTLLANWKLPACPPCSCSRWVLVPCAAGGTQIVALCCPAEMQVQELLVWMTALLSFWRYCVLPRTTRYQLRPSSISVMRFDSRRVQWFSFIYSFFLSDASEGLCLTACCVCHHVMWMLTSAALCGSALSQQNVSANLFSVVAGKQKASQPPRSSPNKK